MNVDLQPDLGACIIAGRRACAAQLIEIGIAAGSTYSGTAPDKMLDEHSSHLAVNGFDITPGIDAAVVEALAWKPPAPKRKWWRFW